jgi:hypothetical protein
MADPLHPVQTRKRHYSYQFTAKHHGGGKADDARWSEAVSQDEEFSVFDEADYHDIIDDDGRFYGVLPSPDGILRDLGTWQQQVAEFPRANEGVPWHGYPIWALSELAPPNRSGEKARPAKEVFVKMEQAGLISARQRKRLYKGDHA